MSRAPGIVVALDDPVQEQIVRGVAAACRINALMLDPDVSLRAAQASIARDLQPAIWVVELGRLHRENLRLSDLLTRLRGAHRDSGVLLSSSARATVSTLEMQWARQAGAFGLLPSLAPERFDAAIEAGLRAAFPALVVASTRILAACIVRTLSVGRMSRSMKLVRDHHYLSLLEDRKLSLDALASWARGPNGFPVDTRRWRLVDYPAVFVGTEAVDRISHHLACDRQTATAIGELLRQARMFRHVASAHPFEDGDFFYRFTPVTARLAGLNLAHLVELACRPRGFERADRAYLGKIYSDCFIGGDAIAWMQARYALSEDEAMLLGQTLLDLGFVGHVTVAHELRNGHYYYRWRGAALATS